MHDTSDGWPSAMTMMSPAAGSGGRSHVRSSLCLAAWLGGRPTNAAAQGAQDAWSVAGSGPTAHVTSATAANTPELMIGPSSLAVASMAVAASIDPSTTRAVVSKHDRNAASTHPVHAVSPRLTRTATTAPTTHSQIVQCSGCASKASNAMVTPTNSPEVQTMRPRFLTSPTVPQSACRDYQTATSGRKASTARGADRDLRPNARAGIRRPEAFRWRGTALVRRFWLQHIPDPRLRRDLVERLTWGC